MSVTGNPAREKAENYLAEIKAELLRVLENAPAFGSVSLEITLHKAEITSVDFGCRIKKQVAR